VQRRRERRAGESEKSREDKRRDEKKRKTAKQKKCISRDEEEKLKGSSQCPISIAFPRQFQVHFSVWPVCVYVRLINGEIGEEHRKSNAKV